MAKKTEREIKALCEARMRELLVALRDLQFVHEAMTGRPWQGLQTHAAPPRDGEASPPDRKGRGAGEDAAWDAFGAPLKAAEACSFSVDTYAGPRGAGWTLTAAVEIEGETWARTANVGPEGHRAAGWRNLGPVVSATS